MGTRRSQRTRRQHTGWRHPVVLVVVLSGISGLLAACGSGATEDPDDDSLDSGFPGGAPEDNSDDDTDLAFSFELPAGPVGPTDEEDPVFEAFRDHGCTAAQDELNEERDSLDEQAALLYQAALHLCQDDIDEANQQLGQVTLPLWPQACPWYQAIAGPLRGEAPSSVYCPVEGESEGGSEDDGDSNEGEPGEDDTDDE